MSKLQNILIKLKNKIYPNNLIKQIDGIYYVNWVGDKWLERFIKYNFHQMRKYDLCLCSIEGKPENLNSINVPKIFFSGENLGSIIEHERCKKSTNENIYKWLVSRNEYYGNYRLSEVDLAMGFAKKSARNYIRFPLWLMYLFPPDINFSEIKKVIENINLIESKSINEAVCINRHDVFGTRGLICDDLNRILKITYAGKWRNNTKELWNDYSNDKLKYMNLFKFNICPENMDAEAYCTEKIFDAFKAGCVPIYAGALNKPEPEIINYNRVIFWDLDGDNKEQIKFVDKLNKNDDLFYKFAKQPKLNDYAVEYVAERFELLRLKLKEILS